jgi:hypothetical protein
MRNTADDTGRFFNENIEFRIYQSGSTLVESASICLVRIPKASVSLFTNWKAIYQNFGLSISVLMEQIDTV